MKTVVLATNNAHKVAEIATALDFPGWEFRTLRELGIESDPAEDADLMDTVGSLAAQAQLTQWAEAAKAVLSPACEALDVAAIAQALSE